MGSNAARINNCAASCPTLLGVEWQTLYGSHHNCKICNQLQKSCMVLNWIQNRCNPVSCSGQWTFWLASFDILSAYPSVSNSVINLFWLVYFSQLILTLIDLLLLRLKLNDLSFFQLTLYRVKGRYIRMQFWTNDGNSFSQILYRWRLVSIHPIVKVQAYFPFYKSGHAQIWAQPNEETELFLFG